MKLANVFRFKDRLPFDLMSRLVYEYTCRRFNSSYYGETDRHLKVRSAEHIIGISPLTFRKFMQSKESAIRDHLQNFNNFHALTSLPSWHMGIINIFLKSKKVCLLSG